MRKATSDADKARHKRKNKKAASARDTETCFWTPEMKAKRKELRKAKKKDLRGNDRRRFARELTHLINARLKQISAQRVLWWANCLRNDARRAWNKIRTDALNKRAGIKAHDPGVRTGSLEPRTAERPAESRAVVYGNEAARETAKYVQRLNAMDWSIDATPFDLTFELAYTALWAWRGIMEDRRAALRAVLCQQQDHISVLF